MTHLDGVPKLLLMA